MNILIHNGKNGRDYYMSNTKEEYNRALASIMIKYHDWALPPEEYTCQEPQIRLSSTAEEVKNIQDQYQKVIAQEKARYQLLTDLWSTFEKAQAKGIDELAYDPDLRKYWTSFYEGEYFELSEAEVLIP